MIYPLAFRLLLSAALGVLLPMSAAAQQGYGEASRRAPNGVQQQVGSGETLYGQASEADQQQEEEDGGGVISGAIGGLGKLLTRSVEMAVPVAGLYARSRIAGQMMDNPPPAYYAYPQPYGYAYGQPYPATSVPLVPYTFAPYPVQPVPVVPLAPLPEK